MVLCICAENLNSIIQQIFSMGLVMLRIAFDEMSYGDLTAWGMPIKHCKTDLVWPYFLQLCPVGLAHID